LCFEAILLISRPIGIDQKLEISLRGHVPRNHTTAFLVSDYRMILTQTQEWRKRLVNKKMKVLPVHGQGRHFMAPGGHLMAQNDSSWQRICYKDGKLECSEACEPPGILARSGFKIPD